MTRTREPPTGPVVDCMERGCKCGKKDQSASRSYYLLPSFPNSITMAGYHGTFDLSCLGFWWYCAGWLIGVGFVGPGFHPHLPGFRHQFLAKALGATMWFFIFYRARCVTLGYTLTGV